MLVLGDGFRHLEPPHHLEGKAVGQAQVSAARLAAAQSGLRVQPLIHKFHPAQGKYYVQEIVHSVPTEAVLHQGPGFMHYIIRGHQLPLFPLRALKSGSDSRMKRIVRVQNSVEPGCVNQDRFHDKASGLLGGRGGESAVVIFCFRIGLGPVFASDVRNLVSPRAWRKRDEMFQNKMGNLALFCWRQRSKFFQNSLGFRAHHLTISAAHEKTSPSLCR
jgi:hypothetical protein